MELELKSIKKNFGDKSVLRDASFVFKKGNIYGLLGRNGAGKTTLMNIISKELLADSGSSFLRTSNGENEITSKDVIYIYSTPILPEFLTGFEFLKFFSQIDGGNFVKQNYSEAIDSEKMIYNLFDAFKFNRDDAHKLITTYSHGMKNKIQMMTMLLSKAPVILLDEPLTSLDVVAAKEIKDILKSIKSDRIILLSTHIMDLAKNLCDEIVLLHNGELSSLPSNEIHTPDFESKIVNLLSDEGVTE